MLDKIFSWTRIVGSTYGPQLSSLLADGASDGRALHLTLGVDDLQSRISLCHNIGLANGFEWRSQPHSEAKDHHSIAYSG